MNQDLVFVTLKKWNKNLLVYTRITNQARVTLLDPYPIVYTISKSFDLSQIESDTISDVSKMCDNNIVTKPFVNRFTDDKKMCHLVTLLIIKVINCLFYYYLSKILKSIDFFQLDKVQRLSSNFMMIIH